MFRARAAVFRDRLGWQVDVRDQWRGTDTTRPKIPYILSRNDLPAH
jgi:N-acyl-L-homoserine lactone synthetase